MSYVSLYRKHRPRTFSEVIGQRHVITALQNQIRQGTLGHAYLFAGPRGTGKTTIARILAMAVNAEGGPNPNPDPDSEVSTSIRDGRAVDVVELDMASHGGVEDARDLREKARFAPVTLPRKVYILDEVHMATPQAFNALLKLIEEPPAHVLFAMATTDPQKVLPTILSRVQRFDLRRVGSDDLAGHLTRLGETEGFTLDEGAMAAVLRAGDGSVRDTLSILEQVLAYTGSQVTADAVADVLGRTPATVAFDAIDRVRAGDVAGVFAMTAGLLDAGHDPARFAADLADHVRDLLLVAVGGDASLVDASADHRARVVAQARTVAPSLMLDAANRMADVLAEKRAGGNVRAALELALANLANAAHQLPSVAASAPPPPVSAPSTGAADPSTAPAAGADQGVPNRPEPAPTTGTDRPAHAGTAGHATEPTAASDPVAVWDQVVTHAIGQHRPVTPVQNGTPIWDGSTLTITFPASARAQADMLAEPDRAAVIVDAVQAITGARPDHVRFAVDGEPATAPPTAEAADAAVPDDTADAADDGPWGDLLADAPSEDLPAAESADPADPATLIQERLGGVERAANPS